MNCPDTHPAASRRRNYDSTKKVPVGLVMVGSYNRLLLPTGSPLSVVKGVHNDDGGLVWQAQQLAQQPLEGAPSGVVQAAIRRVDGRVPGEAIVHIELHL